MTGSTSLDTYIKSVYGDIEPESCPFTEAEIKELEDTNELLVYMPSGRTPAELCDMWGFRINVDFTSESYIRTVMNDESHWFITSNSSSPELLYRSGQEARRNYEDEGLHGLDLRRYLAFAAAFRHRWGTLPDQKYWCFLLSGSYDRSGVSVVGFDGRGVLSHHGWMRNFRAKFAGSRYSVLAPRLEVTAETETLSRAYRGQRSKIGLEAAID
ncbi:hypothetical protein [Nocardia sp. NPDC019395]|uniref:hypothetical protein n=1 Tax=Nocardia sp. NPDC019395 TaxID=3154686 RepID=UPI00340FEA18